ASLTSIQKFHIIHSINSYYGSTQLLMDNTNKYIWIVNEGEYRMMNTFDLAVDHLFFELKKNPWVIKNYLELFINRYYYEDDVKDIKGNVFEGGVTFTHDMGNVNHFSRKHFSAYELTNLEGCFSHMSYEQLTNFIITFGTYVIKTKDIKFLKENIQLLKKLEVSIINRDHSNKKLRKGIMQLDSTRCGTGAEITTYDSLDKSLGQSRNNTYIASKSFSSYIILNELYLLLGENKSLSLENELELLEKTIVENFDGKRIKAIIYEECYSYTIPAAEGMVYIKYLGLEKYFEKYNKYFEILKIHLKNILNKEYCLFTDGAFKLSSTSINSWLSKIYLNQYVIKECFNIYDEKLFNTADSVHYEWLTSDDNNYFAWSDQMYSGIAKGSKYYPRGVTSILWLK
ncbi:MAG: glycoside hydrolase family 52 protein, partial [Fusobacteriaceae bacterium]